MTRKENIQFIFWSVVIILACIGAAIYFESLLQQNPDWAYHPREAHQEQISLEWLKWGSCGIAVITFFNLISFLTHKYFKAL